MISLNEVELCQGRGRNGTFDQTNVIWCRVMTGAAFAKLEIFCRVAASFWN